MNNLKFGIRQLVRNPGFTISVVATLGLCLAANTAILSVLHSAVLKPLPFADAERLVEVFNVDNRLDPSQYRGGAGQYFDFKENADLFEDFAIVNPVSKSIGKETEARVVEGYALTANSFELFGVAPLLGRFFEPSDVASGARHLVVLSQSAWERDFGGRKDAVGQTIQFSGEPGYEIIGVAPRLLNALKGEPYFFTPHVERKRNPVARNFIPANLWARLKPGVTHDAALAQLTALERRYLADVAPPEHRLHFEGLGHRVAFFRPNPMKRPLVMLQGGACLLLILGCVNVLNLSLSRIRKRESELFVRHSLGAGVMRLARLTLVESALLALLSAVVGIVLTRAALWLANSYLTASGALSRPVGVEGAAYLATLLGVAAISLVVGLAPLLLHHRHAVGRRLDSGARGATASLASHRVGTGLVVCQVGVSLALLTGAVLLTRSLRNVMAVDPGFAAEKIVEARIAATPAYKRSRESTLALRSALLESLRTIPGVSHASLMDHEAIGESTVCNLHIQGVDYLSHDDPLPAAIRQNVSFEFFETMGIPILAGASFAFDEKGECWDVLVDAVFAERHFGGSESALGRKLAIDVGALRKLGPKQSWFRIAGVVGRANLQGLDARDGMPVIYRPYRTGYWNRPAFSALLRTDRNIDSVVREVQAKLWDIDPTLPIVKVGSLVESLDEQLSLRRGLTLLVNGFGVVALLLAGIGVYGMQVYDVSQRRREFAIRLAVGGAPLNVAALVVKEGVMKVAAGILLGLILSIYAGRLLSAFLFDVGSLDAAAYGSSLLLLGAAILAASCVPAIRVLRTDPMEALRAE